MQKLWLKNFEHHISANIWLAAEELLSAGQVRSMKEVEKHFWVSLVHDGEAHFEAEMMISPHKIKAFACECFTEGRKMMCAHVAASLIKVRQYLENQADEKRAKKEAESTEKSEVSRLTITAILDHADPEALLAFVREYARRDRDFSLAIKTYFAGSVNQSENPFALLLDAVVPKPASNRPFRGPEFRRLRKMLDDLSMQLDRAEAAINWPTAFQISASILMKIGAFLPKFEAARADVLAEYLLRATQSLIRLYQSGVSPELKDAAWKMLIELGLSQSLPIEIQRPLLDFLSKTATEQQRYQAIQAQFDSGTQANPIFALHLFLAALDVRKMPEAAPRILADYENQPDKIHEALLQLYYLNYWKSTVSAGEFFLEKNIFDLRQKRELEDILLHIAEKSNDKKRQIQHLTQRFKQYGSMDVLECLKQLHGPQWPKHLLKLLDHLRQKGDNDKVAAILATSEDWPALLQHLLDIGEMPLFQRHEASLLQWDKNAVRDFYVQKMGQYLSIHFGIPASGQVRLQLQSLFQKGELELLGQIIRALSQQFPDRNGLASELNEVFPKHLRRKY